MIPKCDPKTGLLPSGCHQCTLEEFKQSFVDNFHNSKSRLNRFKEYVKYNQKICQNVESTRKQMIGGSFTTNKIDPNDVDFVIFINHSTMTREEELFIRRERAKNKEDKRARNRMMKFLKEGFVTANDLPCCDRFFVYWRDRNDKHYQDYLKDKEVWLTTFGFTRKNKRGKQTSRGIISFPMESTTFKGV